MSEQIRISRAQERRAQRPQQIDPHQAYSLKEACAALDISEPQYHRLRAAGKIKPIAGIDNRVRISGAEIIRITSTQPT